MMPFEGKVALVTGESGIGEATALDFARGGASVVIAARRSEQGQSVIERISQLGATGHFVRTDVTVAADVEAMVEAAVARFGRLDYAANNAGIAGLKCTPVADVTEGQWDLVMSVNSAMDRFGETAETASAITWLCSDGASFVNGAVLAVDGGNTTRLY